MSVRPVVVLVACLLLAACGTVIRTTADVATGAVDTAARVVTAPLP